MSLYILDSYAVLDLEQRLLPGTPRQTAFDTLSDTVTNGGLAFPDAVLTECRKFATGEAATVWLGAVAASRQDHCKSFNGNLPMQVLALVPDLLSPEDASLQSHVHVACMAFALHNAGYQVVVVTEDPGLGGDRMPLPEACDELGIAHCSIADLLNDLGLAGCFN